MTTVFSIGSSLIAVCLAKKLFRSKTDRAAFPGCSGLLALHKIEAWAKWEYISLTDKVYAVFLTFRGMPQNEKLDRLSSKLKELA